MAKRATIADIAQASGVSVATVDRVLNGRLPVREDTAQRVYEAAEAIGYHAAGLIRQRIRQDLPEYRLGFLLLSQETHFYREFARALDAAAANAVRFRGVCDIDFWSSQSPEDIVDRINRLAARAHAIAVVSHDHPAVTAAVEALKARGSPVFSLLSDFAPGVREGYIGLNNRKAGRTAAWMIAKCAQRPGKVAVFVGSHSFHGHELREIGLRSYFREHAPEFTVLELADMIVSMTGSKSRIVHLPAAIDDPQQRRPDITRAGEQLGWRPHVDVRDGLLATIAYFDAALRHQAVGD